MLCLPASHLSQTILTALFTTLSSLRTMLCFLVMYASSVNHHCSSFFSVDSFLLMIQFHLDMPHHHMPEILVKCVQLTGKQFQDWFSTPETQHIQNQLFMSFLYQSFVYPLSIPLELDGNWKKMVLEYWKRDMLWMYVTHSNFLISVGIQPFLFDYLLGLLVYLQMW